ncbi:MAG TPA: octaprenyl diphosphate synthase [Deltaproteobacteria bacterium]|nr:octaprenyl diphosphate synthase [Deltaproteobacteria bacterium]
MPPQQEKFVPEGDSLERLALELQKELLEVEEEIQKNLRSEVPSVTQIAQHIVMSGGKRLRPILLLLAARALNYRGPRVIRLGTAVEFIHTATLLHDDVIDNAQLRRGRPSCNAIWDNKMSVLVGDFLYCQASSLIAHDGDLQVLRAITDATTNTTEGEVLEITKSRDLNLGEAEYFKIVEFKTGMLMACATKVGAIIAKAGAPQEKAMADYGMHLGIAFQLADDVLDYTSVEAEFGKEKGVDLKEGKITLPLLHALERCTPAEREIIREGTISARRDIFLKVLEVLKKYGAIDYVLGLAAEHSARARAALENLPPSEAKSALGTLVDYVIQRRK